ncbi:hypothetical protein ISN76_19075 [Dyella halodurans]|uniref:Uncharacterized protein n=1 Tax=Dyella halodurans TaxID=1920171 RepID=A0ABV9C043_9GAMM|nr:hypothetical protein [Dyella halodurans]
MVIHEHGVQSASVDFSIHGMAEVGRILLCEGNNLALDWGIVHGNDTSRPESFRSLAQELSTVVLFRALVDMEKCPRQGKRTDLDGNGLPVHIATCTTIQWMIRDPEQPKVSKGC